VDSTPGSIVVGVDGSPSSRQALHWAAEQALVEHRPLTLAAAVGIATPAWPSGATSLPLEYREAVQAEARAVLADARAELAGHGAELELCTLIEPADPRSMLLQLSENAAMVVIGSRGRGPLRSLLLGSVGVALTRHAACPVVVHPLTPRGVVRNGVVVGADATPGSLPVLELAHRQASLHGLPLLVLHCFWDALAAADADHPTGGLAYEEEQLMLAESLAGLGEKYPDVQVRTELVHGSPARALVTAGERMDLLVVGGHGVTMTQALVFDSVAVSVVEHAPCPVAVVPVTER
jgi:nucleotide-binding universal stress UspA family protein